jgi:hypothetical protein
VVSLLESGALVAAVRLPAHAQLLGAGSDDTKLLGKVHRADALGPGTVARLDGDRALIGLPFGSDRMALAGLLEALANAEPNPSAPVLVPDGAVHVSVADRSGLLGGGAQLRVSLQGDTIAIDEQPPIPVRPLLQAQSPPWACALPGAVAQAAIPPLGVGPTDAFAGRLVIAVVPAAQPATDSSDPLSQLGIVATGVPRDAQAAEELFASAKAAAGSAAVVREEPGPIKKRRLSIAGPRPLNVRADDDAFVLQLAAGVDVEQLTTTICRERPPLLVASGERLAPLVLPSLVTPQVVLKTLAGVSVEDALPLSRLRGIEELVLDATPALTARIRLKNPAQMP